MRHTLCHLVLHLAEMLRCPLGMTPVNYAQLNQLYEKYEKDGFTILA